MIAALGFEGRAATATTLTTTLTADVDVLVVGGTLNPTTLNAANRAALDAFLARGGGVVGLGTAGSSFTTNAGLLTATGTAAASLVSGVANVVNNGGPIVNGARRTSWIFQPVWYSNLGANAVVEQSFAAEPLLSGWWPRTGNTGQHRRRRQGQRRARAGQQPHRRRADRHQPGHAPARQGPALAVRARDPVRRRAAQHGDVGRGRRRGHGARDAVADARHAGELRRVHAGRRPRVHGVDDGQRDLDRG